MRWFLVVTLVITLSAGSLIVSAQAGDSVDPQVHSVIGIITRVSNDSFRLRADNGERELRVTEVTRLRSQRSRAHDGVLRSGSFLSRTLKAGDEALVTYRDADGRLTALSVTVPPPAPNRRR